MSERLTKEQRETIRANRYDMIGPPAVAMEALLDDADALDGALTLLDDLREMWNDSGLDACDCGHCPGCSVDAFLAAQAARGART